jgi:dCTP deaminase
VLLSDRDVLAEIDAGRIVMEPWDPAMLQPSSIDVRLDRYFRVFENHRYPHIDPAADQSDLTRLVEPDGEEPFILHPGEFVLGSTYEVVSLPDDVAARVEGKSSLGRLGLLTHATAGFVDPGFSGHVTLELANVATLPIKLYPGMKIGQFCFFRLSSPSEHRTGRRSTVRATRASAAPRPRARSRTSTGPRSDGTHAGRRDRRRSRRHRATGPGPGTPLGRRRPDGPRRQSVGRARSRDRCGAR